MAGCSLHWRIHDAALCTDPDIMLAFTSWMAAWMAYLARVEPVACKKRSGFNAVEN